MKKITLKVNSIKEKDIDIVVDYLAHGAIVSLPTDTVYGLHCRAIDGQAVDKIYDIKGRERSKPMISLVDSIEMAEKYCNVSKKHVEYLESVWPGPVSVIMKSRGNLPASMYGGRDTLTVRLPGAELLGGLSKTDFLVKIINRTGVPLVSTSLNRSNRRDASICSGNPDGFLDTGSIGLAVLAGEAGQGKPSKVVDIRDINNIKVIRD